MDKKEFEQTMARLVSHLGNMVGQGVPLVKGTLAMAADQQPPVQQVFELLSESVRSGNDFGSSCEAMDIFPEEAIIRIKHAEKSGQLDRELPIIGEDIAYGVYPLNLPEHLDEMKTEMGNRRRKILKAVGQLIKSAAEVRASDVHLEPDEDGGRVRFRLDGVLKHRDVRFDHGDYKAVVARFKEMSALDVGETQRPQDGRILVRNDAGKRLGIRVSVCPFTRGEKVVLRFLDQSSFPDSLESIRISQDKIRTLRQWISRAHGVILVSGPTGSGKTTSLYMLIKELGQKENINVMTVEDPVEILLPGIYQMQLRPSIGLTWNSAIRSMMRQDPDVIGIGEITTPDIAELMIQIAQTGHLTLSQLHAGSAVASIKLLHDMDIPVHMLQETFIGVLSQRLVRRLCPNCKTVMDPSEKVELPVVLQQFDGSLYEAAGCDQCHGTGYRGRDVIMELLEPGTEFWKGLSRGLDEAELNKLVPDTFENMFDDGLKRVMAGDTSLKEIRRALKR